MELDFSLWDPRVTVRQVSHLKGTTYLEKANPADPSIIKEDFGGAITKSQLQMLCALSGQFCVNCSTTLCYLQVVCKYCHGNPGHPDQVGYILQWTEVSSSPSPRIRVFTIQSGQGGQALLVVRKGLWEVEYQTQEDPPKTYSIRIWHTNTRGFLLVFS